MGRCPCQDPRIRERRQCSGGTTISQKLGESACECELGTQEPNLTDQLLTKWGNIRRQKASEEGYIA